jgi:hypothetical protein
MSKPCRMNLCRSTGKFSIGRPGGGRGDFSSLGSIDISGQRLFMSRARIEIVGLRGCFDNPVKSPFYPPTV